MDLISLVAAFEMLLL